MTPPVRPESLPNRRVVVTGMGCVTPLGLDLESTWAALLAGKSGVAPIWVDGSGMNRIIIVSGANALVGPDAAAAATRRLRPAVVLGQLEIPQAATTAAFLEARQLGALTILNPAPGSPVDPELLAVTDWLVPNETEFAAIGGRPLTGDPTEVDVAVEDLGRRLKVDLAVTLGADGVVLNSGDGRSTRIAAPRVRAIDTTGAGDAFVAAFAVGLGLGLDPAAAASLGCAIASDSVTRPGTQGSYPTPTAAAAFLADALREAPRTDAADHRRADVSRADDSQADDR